MNRVELYGFQRIKAEQLAKNIIEYNKDPLLISTDHVLPLYQSLKSITGSGKTLILAEMIELLRAQLSTEPIVLWVSKGRVVVGQTLDNLGQGGKYADNIPSYKVLPLLDCKENDILSSKSLLLIATVGKFNQKDKSNGDRRIFQTVLDSADASLWDMIKTRKDANGYKRDLVVIYDEGHNLSDQQVTLLDELNPIALVAASATVKVPKELEWTISRLQKEKHYTDENLIVSVSNKKVVDSGLIKKNLAIGGYLTPMEIAVNSLLEDFSDCEKVATRLGVNFKPKAIYVCDTNMIMNRSLVDDPLTPFDQRQARPIQIWRHLVNAGIDPETIAVYCNLKMDNNYPAPTNFHLFNGGDNDYDEFSKGSYRHIIFNQTLQEGWDDPSCCFAYIDKSMGSVTQVTQVIGRVLRQPNATHYPDELLNTANFYIKTDEKDIFREIVDEIQKTLLVDMPSVSISYHITKGHGKASPTIKPKRVICVPAISIETGSAKNEIDREIQNMIDYRADQINTVGQGEQIKYVSSIGENQKLIGTTIKTEHSNKVTVRWVFKRELDRLAKKAITLCDIADPKFDALVEYNSKAANNIRDLAGKTANIYRGRSRIVQAPFDQQEVGSVFDGNDSKPFNNGIHPRYGDLNGFELKFAEELDRIGLPWMRNPKDGYLQIPLLDGKGTDTFNPDFIVWSDKKLFALDTKGKHLIMDESQRKLFYIERVGGDGPDIDVKFITERKYDDSGKVLDDNGFTVWLVKQGQVKTECCSLLSDAARICVDLES
jgi:type III restriction enzyme